MEGIHSQTRAQFMNQNGRENIWIERILYKILMMIKECLKITWKFIRRADIDRGGRTPETYCSYVAENKNHKHKLKTIEGTKLFDLLQNTVVSHNNLKLDRFDNIIYIDGVYFKNNLLCILNPRILYTD